MPPQSRGHSPESPPLTGTSSASTTLGSFLDTLSSQTPTVIQPHTPLTEEPANIPERQATSTPTRSSHFDLTDEEDGDDGEATVEDDDEFETHYSRRSSSASSASEQHNPSEAEDEMSVNDPTSPQRLQRIASLPATVSPPHSHAHSLHTSFSTTSLPRPPPPPPLFPPFYNRPPTPLPPSPSLTSLLRPPSLLARSATSTRPTTPDSSDAETPNDTEAAVFHSARRAQPLPPTHPKVPTYEYYGFVLYLASSLAFALYILWSYLPSPFLHGMGIQYYPNRWWSLAIPAWIVMLLVFIYVALLSYNVEYLTLGMGSVECMVDEAANVAIVDEKGKVKKGGSKKIEREIEEEQRRRAKGSWGRGKGKSKKEREGKKERRGSDVYGSPYAYWHSRRDSHGHLYFDQPLNWRHMWNEGTDAVMDIPIGGVCEVLYGEGRDGV